MSLQDLGAESRQRGARCNFSRGGRAHGQGGGDYVVRLGSAETSALTHLGGRRAFSGRRSIWVVLGVALSVVSIGCSRTDVHREPVPGTRFDRRDGVVSDVETGLMWTADSNVADVKGKWAGLTWSEALRFVTEMNQGERPNFGYDDWRLPRARELLGLCGGFSRYRTHVEAFGRSLAIGAGLGPGQDLLRVERLPFDHLEGTAYWSGTSVGAVGDEPGVGAYRADSTGPPEAGEVARAWAVDTGGRAFPLDVTVRKRVWPVRGEAFVP